jgi:hypothetical protein
MAVEETLTTTPRITTLDSGVDAYLSFTGNPAKNTTVVVVPGMGVKRGEQEKKARRSLRRASSWGAHLNVATFLYPGHRTEPLSRFEEDPGVLKRVLDALRGQGVEERRIGFLAICYGANVLCRYREEHNTGRFAILIEPLFGYRGLRLPIALLSRVVFPTLHLAGKPWVWGRKSQVDPRAFQKVLARPVHLQSLGMPMLTISNQRHNRIFNQKHLRAELEGTEGRHEILEARRFSRNSVLGYYRLVTEFLQDWVTRPL